MNESKFSLLKKSKFNKRARSNSYERKPRHYSASVVSSIDSKIPEHWLEDSVPYRLRFELCVLLSREALSLDCQFVCDPRVCSFLSNFASKSYDNESSTIWFLFRYIEDATKFTENSLIVSKMDEDWLSQNMDSLLFTFEQDEQFDSNQNDDHFTTLFKIFCKRFHSEIQLRSAAIQHFTHDKDEEYVMIANVTITNADIIPDSAQPRRYNRVLRQFADKSDRFVRVLFHQCNEGRKRLILNRGFIVGNRLHEFLAYTKNQAFASMCWFVAPINVNDDLTPRTSFNDLSPRRRSFDDDLNAYTPPTQAPIQPPPASGNGAGGPLAQSGSDDDEQRFTADSIRSWMGDFSKIDAPHKYGARIGQSFSDSFLACAVPLDVIEEFPDEIIERNNIQYCFTDGCGQISPFLAQKVWRNVRKRAALLDIDTPSQVPCAFQVRLQGCKGMLVVNPALAPALANDEDNNDDTHWPPGPHVRLRKSMVKFFAPQHSFLEVLRWATPESGVLTRQIIVVLSYLGIRDEVLIGKLHHYCRRLDAAIGEGNAPEQSSAALYLAEVAKRPSLSTAAGPENASIGQLLRLLRSGVPPREPFVQNTLFALDRAARLELLRSTTFPLERARHAFGVVDELGILNYGECFFQFSAGSQRLALAQRVVVTKTPCMHQGDVRVLQAVDVPALHHIVDCVVFPRRGPRPHCSEIGGSDLDGDVYLVCWDRDLIPPVHATAATWHGSFSFDNAVHNSAPLRLRERDPTAFDETNFSLSRRPVSRVPDEQFEVSSDAAGDVTAGLFADPSAPLARMRGTASQPIALLMSLPAPTAHDTATTATSKEDEEDTLRQQHLLELQLDLGDDLAAERKLAEVLAFLSPSTGSASHHSLSPPDSPRGSDSDSMTLATTTATTMSSGSSWSALSAFGLTKMLHIAKENFITNERFHPDGIAQAHLAFADLKGLDCPECTLLAEQFACAVDSVKTGRLVSEYKRPSEWPHFMPRLRPHRRSNSILGRMHDAACRFLSETRTQRSSSIVDHAPLTADSFDSDYVTTGLKRRHIIAALHERNAYQAEKEALSLAFGHLPRDTTVRVAAAAAARIKRQWRQRAQVAGKNESFEERLRRASAWYIVTHDPAFAPVKAVSAYQQALSKYEDDSVTKTGSGRQQPLPPPRRNNSNNTNTNNNMVGRTASIVPKNANNAKSTNLNATALTTVKSNSNNLNNANSSNANNLNSTHANNLNSTHLNSSHSSNRLIPIHSSAPDVSFAWILDDFLVVLKTNAVLRRARSDERLPAITLLYSQE